MGAGMLGWGKKVWGFVSQTNGVFYNKMGFNDHPEFLTQKQIETAQKTTNMTVTGPLKHQ